MLFRLNLMLISLAVVKATLTGNICHQLVTYMNGSTLITPFMLSLATTPITILVTIWWYLPFGEWGDYYFYLLYWN